MAQRCEDAPSEDGEEARGCRSQHVAGDEKNEQGQQNLLARQSQLSGAPGTTANSRHDAAHCPGTRPN
jgi:hypothetical protein